MDEFSWFVGLYEGEGCFYAEKRRCVLQIDMTDEDTIARAAKFLNSSYREVKVEKDYYRRKWRVKVNGGYTRGKLYNLMKEMYPHLSERRKTQLEKVWNTPPEKK